MAPLKFIDLFCGIGGFHTALSSLGHKCVFACDIDADCRQVYEQNYGIVPHDDITTVDANKLPKFDVLCAGFPCQSFSNAGKKLGFKDAKRGNLFFEICKILDAKKPKYFILENVKNLAGHDQGKTWATIYETLTELGYATYDTPIFTNPLHFGVPQNRERVFIIGVRKTPARQTLEKLGLPLPKPSFTTKVPTSIDTILQDESELTPEIVAATRFTPAELAVMESWNEFITHFTKIDAKLPASIFADDMASTDALAAYPGWKHAGLKKNREFYETHKAFLKPWLERARENPAFVNAKARLEWQMGGVPVDKTNPFWSVIFQYRQSGIRARPATYSPSLVAMVQIVYIGSRKRQLTPRETARLQSFPESFKMHPTPQKAYKQFGNSVNVAVVTAIAKLLLGDK